jgi:short-subunit dehydrogenase
MTLEATGAQTVNACTLQAWQTDMSGGIRERPILPGFTRSALLAGGGRGGYGLRMPTALVTGATAGIGAAFARRLAADGYDLVLVARDGSRLETLAAQLRAEHGIAAQALVSDLSEPASRQVAVDRAADPEQPIDLLVNNAGIPTVGEFWQVQYEILHRQLELNVTAVLALSHAVLPGMVKRGSGGVINVASVAGLVPGRGSTYSASKAWVISLSEGLSGGLAGTGVRVLASCPGFTRTEFHQRAGIDMSKAPKAIWLTADAVVNDALKGLERNAVVTIPSVRYRAVVFGSRLVPRRLARAFNSRYGGGRGRT